MVVAPLVVAGGLPVSAVGQCLLTLGLLDLTTLPLPARESHSSLSTYGACPRRYAFRYVERLPGEVPRWWFTFGSAVHRAFEAFDRAWIRARWDGMPAPGYDVLAAWQDRRKRSQGRSVPAPALLALQGNFAGADLEDFEHALFGRDIGLDRVPDGVMASDNDPPWSGVLAFPRVGPAGADDPVLFVSPRYEGPLPDAVARLEVRRLAERRVAIQAARETSVMARMRWASMDRGRN